MSSNFFHLSKCPILDLRWRSISCGPANTPLPSGTLPEGILRALTFRPLEPGEPADLVVLGENPLETVDAYPDVRAVVRAGRRVR